MTATSTSKQSSPEKSKPFYKWSDRTRSEEDDDDYCCSNSCDEDNDSDDDTKTWSPLDTEDDNLFVPRSTSSTRKRSLPKDDDKDDEDDEDEGRSLPLMALANYDAGDLQTPAYSTHGTPGTAIRMFNGVVLGDGSPHSGASAFTPTGSDDEFVATPRKLSEYQGYKKAWAEINELAAFEEDLEYADGKETIRAFLNRMEDRARKSILSQEYDQDLSSGPEYAETRWVLYPEVESRSASKNSGGDRIPKTGEQAKIEDYECHDAGDVTPKEGNDKMTLCRLQEHIQDEDFTTASKNTAAAFPYYCNDFDGSPNGQASSSGDDSDWGGDSENDQETVHGCESSDDLYRAGSYGHGHEDKDSHNSDFSQDDKHLSEVDYEGTNILEADDEVEAGNKTEVSSVAADTSSTA
ncbi:hypothetical protein BGW39_002480 [Mortierella sp. 14UC]|nr:hypothetical protein BGW39_002480 [Mortierella sp. 14UC]